MSGFSRTVPALVSVVVPVRRTRAVSGALKPVLTLVLMTMWSTAVFGQDALDQTDEALHLESPGGALQSDLSVVFDLEGYAVDQRPPGLIFAAGGANPRLSLFVETRFGKRFSSLIQARVDRGFDPCERPHEARLDEYLLRYTPFADGRLNVQAGKFATVFGGWVPRHHSWENPFVTAPLPYENVTVVTDTVAPASPQAFLARVDVADKKNEWVPVVWGPVYATGASAFGSWKRFDYAVEWKTSGLSARPDAWGPTAGDWRHPNVAARVGHRPNAAWTLGLSLSRGPYMRPAAEPSLSSHYDPSGNYRVSDFHQTTAAGDLSFARRHWEFWSELIFSRFNVPNVGDADAWSYYVEGKYKISPRLSAALRWGQQRFGDLPDGAGGLRPWDGAIWRTDQALGWRWTRHIQAKLQYSFSREDKTVAQDRHLVSAQATVRF